MHTPAQNYKSTKEKANERKFARIAETTDKQSSIFFLNTIYYFFHAWFLVVNKQKLRMEKYFHCGWGGIEKGAAS